MIILGIAVGLILLPVLLSIFGPVELESTYTPMKTNVVSVAVQDALTASPSSAHVDTMRKKPAESDIGELIV